MNNFCKVEHVRCTNGERLPLLIERKTGIPLTTPNTWLLLNRWIKNKSSTLEKEARILSYFHWWASTNKIDLNARFITAIGLTTEEIYPSLFDWLRKDFKNEHAHIKMTVTHFTYRGRLEIIKKYILSHLDQTLLQMNAQDKKFSIGMGKRNSLKRLFDDSILNVL